MSTSKLPCRVVNSISLSPATARYVTFSKDGGYCLTCGSDKMLRLWNPYTGALLKTYNGHGQEVLGCDASSDNAKLTSCGADRTVALWDVGTGKILKKYRGHMSSVNCVKFNKQEDSVIASGSYDSTVRLWDTRSRSLEPVQILDDAKDSVPSIQLSEHEILYGSVDGYVRLYDLRAGQLYEDCLGEPVTSVAFSNDGQCVLASTLDSQVRLLDKANGSLLNTFASHTNKEFRIDIALLVNDTHIVSGSECGAVYVWDLITANVVAELREEGDTRAVLSVARHPIKNYLLTTCADNVKLWVTAGYNAEDVRVKLHSRGEDWNLSQ